MLIDAVASSTGGMTRANSGDLAARTKAAGGMTAGVHRIVDRFRMVAFEHCRRPGFSRCRAGGFHARGNAAVATRLRERILLVSFDHDLAPALRASKQLATSLTYH